tara:strand:+ start:2321 stop:5968 length:3648 start_codon:yes stop_codon:yes gene_type:complete
MKQVLARTGNAYFDSFLENKEEEEETEKDEKEKEETTGNAYFDSFLKPTEEETVETSTDETPTPMDELYTKASDEDYALKTYGEVGGGKEVKTYKEFTQDKQFLNTANEYMIARFGEKAGQQEGETDEEFTDRFIEHYRNVTTNTLDLMGQVDWTRTANEKDKANYGALFRDMERLPSFYEEGGTSTFDAIMDYGAALLTDPLTYLGFGAGAVAKAGATSAAKKLFLETAKAGVKRGMTKKAAQEAAKAEVKRQARKLGLKASAKPLALETAAGVGEGYYHIGAASELDVEAHKREEKAGFGEKALGGLLFGTVVGGIGTVGALGVGKLGVQGMESSFKKQAQAKESVLKKQREAAKAKNAPDSTEVADAFDPIRASDWDESVAKGKEILEELDPSTDLTSASLQPELLKRVTKVAKEALKDLKDSDRDKFFEFTKAYLGQKKRASLALRDVLQGLAKETEAGAIDEVVLEGAIKRAGLSTEQFAKLAFNADTIPATTSKGGQSLGIVSGFQRAFDVLKDTDPKLKELFNQKFGKENPTTSTMGTAYEFMQRLDRERRALMVTQLATTVRNVMTGGIRMTMEAGANLIESAIYNLGRGTKEFITTGKIDKDAIWKASKDMINDSFGTLINVVQFGEAKDITEELLKFDPAILRQIDRSLQEVGADQTLSSFTRKMNTLNMAQDKLFRRAVFNATLDKQLRRMGTNVREVLASGKTLPTKMLQNAMEESLSFTFARMPKAGGDKPLDTLGSMFVKANEKLGPFPGFVGLPVGTGAFPYARFMVNALQFNLQYQPGSAISAIANGIKGFSNIAKQDKSYKELGARQLQKAREQMSRGIIGTAAFYAGYKYRLEHQDDGTLWYEGKTDDGRTVDLRPIFPLAPYLLVGEIMVQIRNKALGKPDKLDAKEIIEGFTGATFRTGAGAYMIDNIFQSLGSEEGAGGLNGEKIAEYMGGYLGELVGGGMTPIKMLTDIEAAFDVEAAYVRDSRQLEEFGVMRGVESFKNSATRNMPFLGGLTDKFGQFILGTDLSAQSQPIAESPTRDAPIVKQSTLGAQILGVRKEAVRNTLEKELANFNIKTFEVVPTTGDKKADAFIKARLGKFVERGLIRELESTSYQKLEGSQRKASLKNKLKRYRKLAKDMARIDAMIDAREEGKTFTAFDRAEYKKLTSAQRKLADEYYVERYGKGVLEMQEEEPNKNHFKIGKLMGRLLSRMYQ